MAGPKSVETESDDFDRRLDGYEAITEDSGYPIEFGETGGTFYGTFRGVQELPVKDPEKAAAKGEPVTWTQLLFADEKGELCNIAANYRLQQALDSSLFTEGKQVKIVHHGVKDLGEGRTLNRMSVYVKK